MQAFAGNGLRPLSPCQLRAEADGTGWQIGWIRRTRIGGDDWEAMDVPLGEASERYILRILEGQVIRRETVVSAPEWHYSDALKAADGIAGAFSVEVAQVSDIYGPGLFEQITVLT